MTPRVFYAPPNPPARRAGTVLFVLGGFGLLFGALLLAAAANVNTPAFQNQFGAMLTEIDKTWPFGHRSWFVVQGLILSGYGAGAAVCGGLARSGGRAAMIVALVLTLGVAAVIALAGGWSISHGAADGAIVPLVLCVLHGTAARGLLQALARPVPAVGPPSEPWVPMRDYYLPPVAPDPLSR